MTITWWKPQKKATVCWLLYMKYIRYICIYYTVTRLQQLLTGTIRNHNSGSVEYDSAYVYIKMISHEHPYKLDHCDLDCLFNNLFGIATEHTIAAPD